jgi:uncharacterized SAM-binding protein YcdF (DUF218 family)
VQFFHSQSAPSPVPASSNSDTPTAPKRRRRGCLSFFAVLVLLSFACFFAREWILPAAARCWIVDEQPDTSDAILVLGGNVSVRGAAAARLFQSGSAPRILITSPELSEAQKLGLVPADGEVTRSFLIKSGVPPEAIELIGSTVTSTRDEALALKQWCADHHATRILIPTDLFHSRRVDGFMERTLAGTGTDIRVIALDQPHYDAGDWWKSEDGLIAFQNEIIKWVYYRINY